MLHAAARREGRGGQKKGFRVVNVSLVLVGTDGSLKELPVKQAVSVLGRQDGSELRIPHPDVSRRHCELRVEGDEITLKDLGSSNGTKINGRKVVEADLEAGDVISLGPLSFVLRVNGEPASISVKSVRETAKGVRKPVISTQPKAPADAEPDEGDEDLLGSLANQDPDASSVIDFDFSDEDEDLGKQPRL